MEWNETVRDGMPLYYETREREREEPFLGVSLVVVVMVVVWRSWLLFFLFFSGRNDVIPLSASVPARESESESESNSERERRRREGKPLCLFLPLSCFFFTFFFFLFVSARCVMRARTRYYRCTAMR